MLIDKDDFNPSLGLLETVEAEERVSFCDPDDFLLLPNNPHPPPSLGREEVLVCDEPELLVVLTESLRADSYGFSMPCSLR